MAIVGELERAGLIDTSTGSVLGLTMAEVLEKWDVIRTKDEAVHTYYKAAPGGKRTIKAYSQDQRWKELDLDRENGCIRNIDNPYSTEGGLAVLHGNISENGCIVKTAAVFEQMLRFTGKARVFNQQETALTAIDNGEIEPNTVVIIRYEGPKGGPGMQEMLKPTMSLKAQGLDKSCAMVTDGRYSGASAGLSIGHVSPEAANGGAIALIHDGDVVDINIPNRSINVMISDEEMQQRRDAMNALPKDQAWQCNEPRTRVITRALKSYAAFATSADRGGFKEV